MNQKVFSMGKVKETMKRLVRLLVVALLALGWQGLARPIPRWPPPPTLAAPPMQV